jgi:proteasome alpha subunit
VGLSSDARILIDQARIYAQSNRLTYDEAIDIEVVTKRICDIKQLYTQHAGVRPFGVSIIFGGVDKTGSRLFGTHPSGTYRGYKATAQGAGKDTVLSILKEEYREDMSLEEAKRLGMKCLIKALEARQLPPRIKIAVIPAATRKMELLSDKEIEEYMKKLGVGK